MQFSTSLRWLWESVYLFCVFFQCINNGAMFTKSAEWFSDATVNTGMIFKSDIDALFAFGLISNVTAWFTIAFSTFRRSRSLVFPTMIFSAVCYIIAMSLQTHIFVKSGQDMSSVWQFPLGWAACIAKVITCCSINFWDKNESEDKYSTCGYMGRVPVFPLSRLIAYFASGALLFGHRGFMINSIVVATNSTRIWNILNIVGTIFSFVIAALTIIKPQKGLTIIFLFVAFGIAIGQGVLAQREYDGLPGTAAVTGIPFATKMLEWCVGYTWSAMVMYFVAIGLTMARAD